MKLHDELQQLYLYSAEDREEAEKIAKRHDAELAKLTESNAALLKECHEWSAARHAQSESLSALRQHDARKLLMRVVPDMNGDPVEVYAESFAQVEKEFNDQALELDDTKGGLAELRRVAGLMLAELNDLVAWNNSASRPFADLGKIVVSAESVAKAAEAAGVK